MTDESGLRERASLGAKFKEHLPDIQDALNAVEAEYVNELLNTFDRDHRDNLWRTVQVCRRLKQHFGEIVSSGALASHQLEELKRLR